MAKITEATKGEFLLDNEAAAAFVRNVHGKARFYVYLGLEGERNDHSTTHLTYLKVSRRQALDAIRRALLRGTRQDTEKKVKIRTHAPYSENSPASVFIG